MKAIGISELSIGTFRDIWINIFLVNKYDVFALYEKMRFALTPEQKKMINEDIKNENPFTMIWNGLCWENVILPVYFLNGQKLSGRYKILTNAEADKYHMVVFDCVEHLLIDPTYEKFQDCELLDGHSCKGTDCTKLMLGEQCFYFELEYYLRDFEIQGDQSFNTQLREVGGRFLEAIGA